MGGKLYFESDDPVFGTELWSFDGTTASMVKDLNPGLSSGYAGDLIACGDRLYYTATTPGTGSELFVSDGTAAGTQLAVEIFPGLESGNPANLTLCGGDLLFAATGPDGDRELYRYSLPGAHVIDLGFGGSGAQLTATAPVVGQSVTATVANAPTGAIGVVALSAPVAPSSAFVTLGNASWIDPSGFVILGASSLPSWAVTSAIPSLPSFVGLQVNVQAWFLPPSLLPASTSNGLRLVFGN